MASNPRKACAAADTILERYLVSVHFQQNRTETEECEREENFDHMAMIAQQGISTRIQVACSSQDLGIEIRDVDLGDADIRGVAIGSPLFAPLIIINSACADASGVSGRRTTLGHELCHLLFDRLRMRSLARVESPRTDSDRLIEMRANALAIELLVPMSTLLTENGTVVDDEELRQIATERQVSFHALESHADNLRDRLRRQ
jgi:Zn-dependent peptidase ImmA (M78 family)